MKIYFDALQQIEKSEFLDKFKKHLEKRKKMDATEKRIFQTLERTRSLDYHLGILNTMGIENLVLPQHAVELEIGKDPDRPVKVGGDDFLNVIRKYNESYIPNSRFSDCVIKIAGQQSHFFNHRDSLLRADFLFVCNQREYAHPGEDHYDSTHGDNKLYIGNGFHRFVAYGLWITQNGFRPLELHYVEQSHKAIFD